MKSSVLIIYTGGTIGMKTDTRTGALVPFDFSGIYDEFPSLKRLNVDIEVMTLPPIDSSNVSPDDWSTIAHIIRDNYHLHDGFVVLHGTDTMSYTASALSFMLRNLAKPVVFTGSQIPIGVLRTDGRENLITAIEIAGARRPDGRPEIAEVALYFQNRLFRANRTSKISAEALNAFRSYNYPPLAEVGVNIAYDRNATLPYPRKPLEVFTQFNTDVLVVKLFPGIRESAVRGMLALDSAEGIVLETFGAGNAPTAEWFVSAVSEAVDAGKIVLNVTQCPDGTVEMGMYETGLALQRAGVLCGHDITTEAAVAKMMYVLGIEHDRKRRIALLNESICGEFTT